MLGMRYAKRFGHYVGEYVHMYIRTCTYVGQKKKKTKKRKKEKKRKGEHDRLISYHPGGWGGGLVNLDHSVPSTWDTDQELINIIVAKSDIPRTY